MKKKTAQEKTTLRYRVPENYFEQSKERMMKHSLNQGSKTKRNERLLWLGVAASIAALIGLFESEKTQGSDFDQHFESIIIEAVAVEDAAFDDWFEEEYILAGY